MFFGINIKNRSLRLVLITASMLRIRHYRGHGIHSPFAYSIVRQVFMKRRIKGSDREVYNSLRGHKVGRYWAIQLQNLYTYSQNHQLNFVMPQQTIELPEERQDMTIDCVIAPRLSRMRYRRCKELVRMHNGMSIDNRGYILIINDRRLPKQHFKL